MHERRYDPTPLETIQSATRLIPPTPQQRRFASRSLAAALAAFVAFASFVSTYRFFQKKFFITTGEAEWIWVTDLMRKEQPVAAFFVREFAVPPTARYVRINVAADPGYALYFNGAIVGRAAFNEARAIDSYDVTAMKRSGANRIVVVTRSEKGSGGVLASVDFGPMSRNVIVTDRAWRVHREWSPDLPLRDRRLSRPVRSFGPPPIGRWNFPERRERHLAGDAPLVNAGGVVEVEGAIRETRILSGVAVASLRRERARAFDFGEIEGLAVVERASTSADVVLIRFANAPEELTGEGTIVPIVFATGEQRVVDPQVRSFRYVVVYGSDATASVMPR